MSPLENISWERLVWDKNRLIRPAQRDVHATAQERAGAATAVTERSAVEIAPSIDPANVQGSLERAYDAYANPERVTRHLAAKGVRGHDVRRHLRTNIWWAEEWLRPDSPFEVRILDEKERARALDILEHMARRHVFDGLSLDTAERFPDAMIIAEAAALGRRYIMTEDNFRETIGLDQWSREACNDGLLTDPELVIPADAALRQWAADHPGFALETIGTAFWPRHDDASAHDVEQRVRVIIPKLSGARLGALGDAARRELQVTNNWPSVVERMRETLPHKTRAADRRHPTHPQNTNRDWSRPAPDFEDAISRRRWKINVEDHATIISEIQHTGRYRAIKTFPAGAELALAEYLIDHDIEVSGMPTHGGRHDNSGGDARFINALSAAVGDERGREPEL